VSVVTRQIERRGESSAALFFGRMWKAVRGALLAGRSAFASWSPRRRPYNVLRLELTGDVPELPPQFALRDLGRRRPTTDLVTLLATLRSAREDPELGLVLVDIHGLDAGWGTLQSLRRALLAVRAAGKPVWAYLSQPGTRDYYLASAATRVLLPPAAVFDVTGIASEVVFLKGALDKLGIEAQLARAGRFKAAAEPFTRSDMSPEHRAMAEALLDDLYDQLVTDVAKARRLEGAIVRAAFTEGPLLARDALGRGLVDALAYPDELRAALEERFGDPAPIDIRTYQRRRALAVRRAALGAPTVGVLTVAGAIGARDAVPAGGGARATNWRGFRRELDALVADANVAAVVLRIDSPGGSGLASDLMWREIVQARRRKPVLASMGDVAASGGYYLAAGADHVTAEPATLTGSIGVLAGKPVLRGLYDHLGITKELVVRGNAARDSDYVPLDTENLARLRREAEAFYADFVGKVAAGRGLTAAAVENVAEGRVWTGRQAHERGLVDALGGLEQALEETKRRLGLEPGARVALTRRPYAGSWWQSALTRVLPRDGLSEALGILAPALRGERVLAAMPFLVRFLGSGTAPADTLLEFAGRDVPDARAAGRGGLRESWSRVAAALRPPLVF
jgi:protease IV